MCLIYSAVCLNHIAVPLNSNNWYQSMLEARLDLHTGGGAEVVYLLPGRATWCAVELFKQAWSWFECVGMNQFSVVTV